MTKDEALKNLEKLRAVANYWEEDTDAIALGIAIESLKSQKWIPCSERLPELGETVLTFDGVHVCVDRRIEWMDTPEGQFDGEWWIDGYDGDEYDPVNLRDGTVIAWRPLLEPSKSEIAMWTKEFMWKVLKEFEEKIHE